MKKYRARFYGWDKLDLIDLIAAYRKAKVDCFYQNISYTAVKFAEYENNLLENLQNLLKILKEGGFHQNKSFQGSCLLIPKKLSKEPLKESKNSHAHFSDPSRAFTRAWTQFNQHLIANK